MKKLGKYLPFIMLIFAFTINSCSKELEEKNDLSSLDVDFDYKQFEDFEINLPKSTSADGIINVILKNYNKLENSLAESTEPVSVSYNITYYNNKLKYSDFKTYDLENYNMKTTGPSAIDLIIADAFECPSGQTHVETCFSQSCVEETLGGLGSNFSRGESISLHHTGLGGVKICSNVQ